MAAKRKTPRIGAKKKVAKSVDGPLEGVPPAGKVDARAVEAAIANWVAIPNKRPSDYCTYSQAKLVADLDEMSEGRRDLKLFTSRETPITARHFDWLDLLSEAFVDVGDEDSATRGDAAADEPKAEKIMRRTADARGALARRAESSGVPVMLFRVTRYDSPSDLFTQASRAARQARRQLPNFVGASYSKKLIEDLEASLVPLKALAEAKDDRAADSRVIVNRRHALKYLAYEAMTVVAPWGREVTSGDDSKSGRYTLDHVFESGRASPPSAPPEPAQPN